VFSGTEVQNTAAYFMVGVGRNRVTGHAHFLGTVSMLLARPRTEVLETASLKDRQAGQAESRKEIQNQFVDGLIRERCETSK
jgi:hypothetical protein